MTILEPLIATIANHWMLSTYFGVVTLNEGAILASFSLFANDVPDRYPGLVLVSVLGLLTNDLILYAIARFGRFSARDRKDIPESLSERIVGGNVFFLLLFLKFLFGIRIILTLYLLTKRKLPLRTFIAYDALGSLLYVAVIGGVGWSVGRGSAAVLDTYHMAVRGVTIVAVSMLAAYAMSQVAGKYWRRKRLPGILGQTEWDG